MMVARAVEEVAVEAGEDDEVVLSVPWVHQDEVILEYEGDEEDQAIQSFLPLEHLSEVSKATSNS